MTTNQDKWIPRFLKHGEEVPQPRVPLHAHTVHRRPQVRPHEAESNQESAELEIAKKGMAIVMDPAKRSLLGTNLMLVTKEFVTLHPELSVTEAVVSYMHMIGLNHVIVSVHNRDAITHKLITALKKNSVDHSGAEGQSEQHRSRLEILADAEASLSKAAAAGTLYKPETFLNMAGYAQELSTIPGLFFGIDSLELAQAFMQLVNNGSGHSRYFKYFTPQTEATVVKNISAAIAQIRLQT